MEALCITNSPRWNFGRTPTDNTSAYAGAEFDLAPTEAVLDRWWGIAVIRANQEQEQLARARKGVFDGLWERDEAGNWVQL